MIGGPRLGIVLRDHRLAALVVAGGQVRHVFSLEEQENPAGVLRGELDSRRLRIRRASLGLPRSLATVKILELPTVAGTSLLQMVAFELERHLPFPAEEAVFDFVPLPALRRSDARRVLLVACEKRTVERAIRLVEEARLAPRSLTVACHDLVALLGPVPKKQRVVWVHLAGDEAELLFLRGRHLRLTRSVPAGPEADLEAEIRKSLQHLDWDELGGLWVSGDRAGEIVESGELAQFGPTPTAPPLSARAQAAVRSLGNSANGLTLLALAVALGRRRRPLTLLPPALRPPEVSRGQVVTAFNFALAAVLGLSLVFAKGYQTQWHLNRVNQAIRALDPEVKATEQIVAEVERKRQLLATIQAAQESAIRPLPILRDLTELIPPDTWLTTLSLDSKGVELSGQANAASQLIPLLEGSSRIEKVEFASPVTKTRDKEQFRIKASWEMPPKPATPEPAPPKPPAARPGAAQRPRGARSP